MPRRYYSGAIGLVLGLLFAAGPGAPSAIAADVGMSEVAALAPLAGATGEAGTDQRALLQQCSTNPSGGFPFPAVSGAASNNFLVVVTNVSIGLYRRSDCGVVFRKDLKDFFIGLGGLTENDSLTQPRVIFDFDSKRFFVVVLSHNSVTTNQSLYYAVSTPNVGPNWYRARIVLSQGSSFICKTTAASQWFFASAGVNKGRWFVTANNFPASGTPTGAILSLDKAKTLTGQAAQFKCFKGLPINLAPPIVRDNNTNAHFLSTGQNSGTAVARRRLQTPGNVSSDQLFVSPDIAIPAWQTNGAQFAEQVNGCPVLVGDGRFASASIQIGSSLWNVHTINHQELEQARWRLYKFSATGTTPQLIHTPNAGSLIHHSFNASVATGSAFAGRLAFVTFTRIVEPQPGLPAGQSASMLVAKGSNAATSGWTFQRIVGSGTEVSCSLEDPFIQFSEYSSTQIDPLSHELSPEAWSFSQLTNGTAASNWNTWAARTN